MLTERRVPRFVQLAAVIVFCAGSRPVLTASIPANNQGETRVPASLQGELQPTIHRFKLGGFEVATVLDARAIREGLHPHYGANASADEVQALARANNIDTQRLSIPTSRRS